MPSPSKEVAVDLDIASELDVVDAVRGIDWRVIIRMILHTGPVHKCGR